MFISAMDDILAARTDYRPCERDVSCSIRSSEADAITFFLDFSDMLQIFFGPRWYWCLRSTSITVDECFSFNMKKLINTHSDHIPNSNFHWQHILPQGIDVSIGELSVHSQLACATAWCALRYYTPCHLITVFHKELELRRLRASYRLSRTLVSRGRVD